MLLGAAAAPLFGEPTVVPGKVYDLGKLSFSPQAAQFPELRRDDLRMCWIAAGANLLQHWQDSYLQHHDAGKAVPNGLADNHGITPRGTGYLAIYREFLNHWTDGGGMNINALTWWLQGTLAYTPSPEQVAQRGLSIWEDHAGGGYFTGLFPHPAEWQMGQNGSCGCVVDYGTTPDPDLQTAPRTLDAVQRILDEMLQKDGQGGLLAIMNFDRTGSGKTGAHAVTCWGYEKGPDGKLCALYLTDSDDRALTVFRVNAHEQGGAVVLSSHNPACNYSTTAPVYNIFRALSFINTPGPVATRTAPADSLPADGTVQRNTQLTAPAQAQRLLILASEQLGQTIFTTTAPLTVQESCQVGPGALASMQAGGKGAFSFGTLHNNGECRLAHATGVTVQDGRIVNGGYLDLDSVGTVQLQECTTHGCVSMENGAALQLGSLRVAPVHPQAAAAIARAEIRPHAISAAQAPAQLRDVAITAEQPLLIRHACFSGAYGIHAHAGVQLENVTLTLTLPKNIIPAEDGEIGIDCSKMVTGDAFGTLNIRLAPPDLARLAAMGVRVLRLRFADSMQAEIRSDVMEDTGEPGVFILPPPGPGNTLLPPR